MRYVRFLFTWFILTACVHNGARANDLVLQRNMSATAAAELDGFAVPPVCAARRTFLSTPPLLARAALAKPFPAPPSSLRRHVALQY